MSTRRTLLIALLATAAGLGTARAQSAPADVNVVNLVDTNVVNTPDVRIVNTPTVQSMIPSDSAPVIVSQDPVPLNQSLITEITFRSLVTAPTSG